MKIPLIKLPTYQDKMAFLNEVYDRGWSWVGYSRGLALKEYDPVYDKETGFIGMEIQMAKKGTLRFSTCYVSEIHTLVNSPAQFFRYAKKLAAHQAAMEDDDEF